ncbi:hypothetical protein GCM10010191_89430 [Actinomadura vinacea]|uniref:Uncharacterized protein n=1 Tax=Actinomadura vinacea TaxID=115336 RepID=A0ABN3KD68_9ACTN
MVCDVPHRSRARAISGESSSGVPSTVARNIPKTGLAAQDTRSSNHPFTARLAMHPTSTNPHSSPPDFCCPVPGEEAGAGSGDGAAGLELVGCGAGLDDGAGGGVLGVGAVGDGAWVREGAGDGVSATPGAAPAIRVTAAITSKPAATATCPS